MKCLNCSREVETTINNLCHQCVPRDWLSDEQAIPSPGMLNINNIVMDEVPRLIKLRQERGLRRYGRPLEAFNGRDAFQDLIEELIDAIQYAYQVKAEFEFYRNRYENCDS